MFADPIRSTLRRRVAILILVSLGVTPVLVSCGGGDGLVPDDSKSTPAVPAATRLAAPGLSAPMDASTTADPAMTFSWSEVTGADHYEFEVGEAGTGFLTLRHGPADVAGTSHSFSLSDPLPGGDLEWRVRAVDAQGVGGDWSATYHLTANLLNITGNGSSIDPPAVVTIPFEAQTQAGDDLICLGPENVSLTDNGVAPDYLETLVTLFHTPKDYVSEIALYLDVSGSMTEDDQNRTDAINGVIAFLNALYGAATATETCARPNVDLAADAAKNKVSIYLFNSDVTLYQAAPTDAEITAAGGPNGDARDVLIPALQDLLPPASPPQIVPRASTNLYGTILDPDEGAKAVLDAAAVADIAAGLEAETSVVIVTDGGDRAGEHERSVAIAEVNSRSRSLNGENGDRYFYSVGVSTPHYDSQTMQALSPDGTFTVDQFNQLADALRDTARRINRRRYRHYELQFCSPWRSGNIPASITVTDASTGTPGVLAATYDSSSFADQASVPSPLTGLTSTMSCASWMQDKRMATYDEDGDGYYSEQWVGSDFPGFTEMDCDDENLNVHPGATELPGNGIDEDCDPSTGP